MVSVGSLLPAYSAGWLLGRLMPFYGPQAGQKRAMAAGRGGRREQIEPQAKRQREEGGGTILVWGLVSLGSGFAVSLLRNYDWIKLP